ncbi:cytochrome P450 [Salinisphaera sp. LB1]|uniref:cytochrome P450 n=1 Tax=Salinisphaera sp. LB1 TaxID=2183911 RepID=UPI000D706B8B|nr:cytochrome P450 [Salinisphaera sp. LB1]AWN15438.1 cytochrome P450 [Salinisphaera sp. LB1]
MTAMRESNESTLNHATADGLPGPATAFPVAPDDATRRQLVAWQAEYGDLFAVPSTGGGPAHWIVNDPALAQQVLVRHAHDYTKGMGLDRVKILLGNGIMVSEGDFWTRQRRLIQPAFRPRRLADFNVMIVAENLALAERWQQVAERGDTLEAESHTSELTLVIVLKSIFGADYARLVEDGANPFALLTEEPARDLRFAARFHRLKQTVDAIIERRLAEGPRKDFDFLGHLLAARNRDGEPMSRPAIIDEVMTLIVAGHETTASALAFAWYLIARHPNVCARMQAEVDATDESGLRETGGADRETLAYTDRVVAEVLRLYPPGWLLSRRALTDQRLGDHTLAAGTQLFVSPYLLQRHPGYWRDPERFDPDRFARADEPRHRLAYLPFAAGPRHCIGEHLAATEMRVHLATLLRRFTPTWLGDGEPAIESAINLRPADGIYLQLTPR